MTLKFFEKKVALTEELTLTLAIRMCDYWAQDRLFAVALMSAFNDPVVALRLLNNALMLTLTPPHSEHRQTYSFRAIPVSLVLYGFRQTIFSVYSVYTHCNKPLIRFTLFSRQDFILEFFKTFFRQFIRVKERIAFYILCLLNIYLIIQLVSHLSIREKPTKLKLNQ